MLSGSSAGPNEWIVTVGKVEVHRCVMAEALRTVRL